MGTAIGAIVVLTFFLWLASQSHRLDFQGYTLRVKNVGGEDRDVTRIVLKGERGISLSGETIGIRIAKAFAAEDFDVDVGDAPFDKPVHFRGQEELIVASMNAGAREAVRALVAMGGEVKPGGEVTLQMEGDLWRTPLLLDLAAVMAAVARSLSAVRPGGEGTR